ncbi:UxaA family hydrolase [Pseudooceanicola sp. LIPI14-2-Ac024]|uniref:UxaA family hydrolase n=1 Tax=Pseudooceanicola sp. LIPI14-2-Ac024 TaxID=3344875 RepID=UPI0035CFA996
MAEPILLNQRDNVVVLPDRLDAGADPLGLNHPLPKGVAAGHKIARQAIAKGAEILKFGQVIGHASTEIAAGDHVHSHNCDFADHSRDYRIGADLDAARAAIPQMQARTFKGYLRDNGQVGTRNYIALCATVNCSATVIRRAAAEIEASGLLDAYPNVDGIAAFAHGTGCGMDMNGRGFDILDRVLWGHATHPNVGATIFVGLGCEMMQIARMQNRAGGARGCSA